MKKLFVLLVLVSVLLVAFAPIYANANRDVTVHDYFSGGDVFLASGMLVTVDNISGKWCHLNGYDAFPHPIRLDAWLPCSYLDFR